MHRVVHQPLENISFARGTSGRTGSILYIIPISVITDRVSRTSFPMNGWSSSLGGGPFEQRERPERGGDGPQVIVVAVDDLTPAHHAVSYGAGVARRNGAGMTLVYVRQTPPLEIWCGLAGVALESADLEDPGLVLLEQLAEVVRTRYRVTVDCQICDGDTAHEIARVADELQADAVIVGRPRSWLHRFAGSVATQLVRRGSWPVTVVP